MTKVRGKVVAPVLPPVVEYPKYLLAVYSRHGSDDQFIAVAEAPSGLEWVDTPSVKVARYVLVGTGVIEHSAPQYVEHAKPE